MPTNTQQTLLRYGLITLGCAFALLAAFLIPALAQGAHDSRLAISVLQTTPGAGQAAQRDYSQFDESEQGQDECGTQWVVQSGETISVIVINCDVPLDTLLAANPGLFDPNTIRPGQVINIPAGSFDEIYHPTGRAHSFAAVGAAAQELPQTGQITPTQTVTPTQPVTPTQGVSPTQQVPATGLEAIAAELANRRFVSRAEFERVQAERRDYRDFDEEEQGRNQCDDRWIVQSGESLSLIVINCDVPFDTLLAANPQVQSPDFLFPGEVIAIPEGQFPEITEPGTGRPYTIPPGFQLDTGDEED